MEEYEDPEIAEWVQPIVEECTLESIRHQLNHIRDWESGMCECVPRGADEDLLQNRYRELTGFWWDPFYAENTSVAPKCCRVSESEALSELYWG